MEKPGIADSRWVSRQSPGAEIHSAQLGINLVIWETLFRVSDWGIGNHCRLWIYTNGSFSFYAEELLATPGVSTLIPRNRVYCSVVRPAVQYGAIVCWQRIELEKTKLNHMQSLGCLMAMQVLKSTLTEALEIQIGLATLNLRKKTITGHVRLKLSIAWYD